jgi:cytochrome b
MTAADTATETGRVARPETVNVWDPLVRIFHWSLVGIIAFEFLGEDGDAVHRTLGYVALGLIAFRIIWGFVGTKHARFSDFVKSPKAVIAYLKSLLAGHPRRYLGHNPAGGAMVIVLLVMTAIVGGSGWAMHTEALWGQEWVEELHEISAWLMLVFVGAHVLGVIAAGIQHRENLVLSMLTGKKKTNV